MGVCPSLIMGVCLSLIVWAVKENSKSMLERSQEPHTVYYPYPYRYSYHPQMGEEGRAFPEPRPEDTDFL